MQALIRPDKATYSPNEPIHFCIHLTDVDSTTLDLSLTIYYLNEVVDTLTTTLAAGASPSAETQLRWSPPSDAPRGYGAVLTVADETGTVLTSAETSCDVLHHWTQAPRYGFLCDFTPDRNNLAETADWLTRHHINGVQFYDWMYRHDQLLPPIDPFIDPLGRALSLTTVTQLIDALHQHNIAAMPYTAVYAASNEFHASHPDWALFQADATPYAFEDFLMIMDPSADSPWHRHLLTQFETVLDATDFDGIHIDQYGQPRTGFDASGAPIDLAQVFPDFIAATQALVQAKRGSNSAVVFNAVENWPIDTLAPSQQTITYIEIWPPDTSLHDLHTTIRNAQQLAPGKPVVMACYVTPNWPHTAELASATIFASGGFHISLGEPNGFLSDPYFPKHGTMSAGLQAAIGRHYDFAVRYENVLALAQPTSAETTTSIRIDGVPTSSDGQGATVWAQATSAEMGEIVQLINLLGVENPTWSDEQPAPAPLTQPLRLHIQTSRPVTQAWTASPDGGSLSAESLSLEILAQEGDTTTLVVTLPDLIVWRMLVLT